MRSVVETLSLRIRAEPPNSPGATEGRTLREYLYVTDTGKGVLKCDLLSYECELTCV